MELREGVADVVRALDERGILQTIVSKNDAEPALAAVKRLGLDEYFLFPTINWGAKSENLRHVAQQLNLGLSNFALIDDSPFERNEVRRALPMVRTYAECHLHALLDRPEFDVPVTEVSRKRRLSYRTEAQRMEARALFPGDYLEFLRECEMRMRVFVPHASTDVLRCVELVQRSNQLNLSSRQFTDEEFADLLVAPGFLNVAFECMDKFGSYGIVGFCSVDERNNPPVVTNFVLSCRVAQKRVEHAFFHWLADRQRARGYTQLVAEFVKTSRNGPLATVFDDLGFRSLSDDGGVTLKMLTIGAAVRVDDTVDLTAELEP